jgi:hypothetical protein
LALEGVGKNWEKSVFGKFLLPSESGCPTSRRGERPIRVTVTGRHQASSGHATRPTSTAAAASAGVWPAEAGGDSEPDGGDSPAQYARDETDGELALGSCPGSPSAVTVTVTAQERKAKTRPATGPADRGTPDIQPLRTRTGPRLGRTRARCTTMRK